jgi:hypothetical protein
MKRYLIKKVSDCPFKSYDFWKIPFSIKIEILPFATHCFLQGQTGEHRIKPVSAFLPTSPAGERIAEAKLAALLSPSSH